MVTRRADYWTAHDPKRCGADELPEGYPCRCGLGWPRRAMWWQGECAIGRANVERLTHKMVNSDANGDTN